MRVKKVIVLSNNKSLKAVSALLVVLIVIILGVMAFIAIKDLSEYKEVNDTQKEVIEAVIENPDNKTVDNNEDLFSINWAELLSINKDVVAWIRIPECNINYPVVQGISNDQYLRKNIYGDYSRGGTLFVDADTETPFQCANTIIYGHNLMNGAMFASLKNYSNDDYFKEHSVIYVYLPDDEVREYKIISFHNVSARDKNIYNPYVSDIEEYSYHIFKDNLFSSTDTKIYSNDKVITLSTCTNGDEDARYVIHAVWRNKV